MSSIDASVSSQFRIGDITINRLGYRAMRIEHRFPSYTDEKNEELRQMVRVLSEKLGPSIPAAVIARQGATG